MAPGEQEALTGMGPAWLPPSPQKCSATQTGLDENRPTLALPLWAPSWTSAPGDNIGCSPLPEFHHSCGVWGRYAGSQVPLAEDRQAPSTDKEFGPLSPPRPPIWFYCPQSWTAGGFRDLTWGPLWVLGVCLDSPPPPLMWRTGSLLNDRGSVGSRCLGDSASPVSPG